MLVQYAGTTVGQHQGAVSHACGTIGTAGSNVISAVTMGRSWSAGTSGGRRPPRRGRLISRVELHLAASSPLFAMLAWRFLHQFWWFLSFLVLTGVGVLIVVLLIGVSQVQRQGDPFRLAEVVDLGDQVAGYVVGYLLPFLLPADASTGEAWLTAGAVAIIGIVLVQSNQVHLNPLLYLFGYRVYGATTDDCRVYYLIARSDLSRQEGPLVCVEVASSLLIEQRGSS